jgi:DNA modification methylase
MSYELILGDCLEVMRGMEAGSVDAVITDPPYPGLRGGHSRDIPAGIDTAGIRRTFTESVGDEWGANLDWVDEALRVARFGLIVCCTFHSVAMIHEKVGNRAKPVCLITWYKHNSPPTGANLPKYTTEFIWCFNIAPGLKWDALKTTMFDIPGLPAGCFAQERILNRDGSVMHPTQKPIRLMKELLAVNPMSVLDPFMGSGTTGVACIKTGRNFIGIEIDPTYYKIAEKRISEAAMQLPLLEIA